MRRRSGGIHSNSEEEFIELADVAQQCNSLFYDEPRNSNSPKRRKYAFSVDPLQPDQKKEEKSQKPVSNNKLFESFDFDQQTYSFSKDFQELQKQQKQKMKKTSKTHITVLSNHATMTYNSLHQILQVEQKSFEYESRSLNMLCHVWYDSLNSMKYIDCYWVIDADQMQKYGVLLQIYIKKCHFLVDLTRKNDEQSIQRPQNTSKNILREVISTMKMKRDNFGDIQM